jgi:hypothetical protein
MRRLPLIALTLAAVLGLAGCGKAGRPLAPPGSTFPEVYPNKNLAPAAEKPAEAEVQKQGEKLPEPASPSNKGSFAPNGAFIDPSALQPQGPAGILPQPLQANQPTNIPFDSGMGAPSTAPLPPVQPSTGEPKQ